MTTDQQNKFIEKLLVVEQEKYRDLVSYSTAFNVVIGNNNNVFCVFDEDVANGEYIRLRNALISLLDETAEIHNTYFDEDEDCDPNDLYWINKQIEKTEDEIARFTKLTERINWKTQFIVQIGKKAYQIKNRNEVLNKLSDLFVDYVGELA